MLLHSKTTLRSLFYRLTVDYYPYYLVAIFSLLITHYIQIEIPFMAMKIVEMKGVSKEMLRRFLLFAVMIIFFRSCSRWFFFYPARVMQKRLKMDLMESLLHKKPETYGDYNSGQIFQIINTDLDQLRAMMGFSYLHTINIILAILVIFPKVIAFDAALLWPLIPIFIAVSLNCYLTWSIYPQYLRSNFFKGEIQQFLMDSYHGKKTINTFQKERDFSDLFDKKVLDEAEENFSIEKKTSYMRPMVSLMLGLSILWASYVVFKKDLNVGVLILFSGVAYLIQSPLSYLSWLGITFSASFSSWERIVKFLKVLEKEDVSEKNLDLTLLFRGTIIPYPFEEGGSVTSLVGETGVGKSYCLNQLANYFKHHIELESDYVQQKSFLFNDTLANNLFLLNEKKEKNKIHLAKELLKIFELDELEKEDVFKLELGENGKKVSGGQAKRISLIRSLLTDADILIWDDPFSSMDYLCEKNILSFLKKDPRFKDKKIIITTHRYSTLKNLDHILYLKMDGVVEEGSAKKLLKESQDFYEYFKKQMV